MYQQPNYNFNIQDQRLLQQTYYSRSAYTPINDGFAISDNTGGTVVAVDGQSRADYDRMIKSNFKYSQENNPNFVQDAYKESARTGKPIVAVFGSFEHNNPRQLVEQVIPQAKNGAAKDAIFMFIDPTKIKDNPELAKFAQAQVAGGHNAAVSIVFNVKPGEGGKLQPEAPQFRWQGSHSSMIDSFNQAITAAKEKQESYRGKFDATAIAERSEVSDKPTSNFASSKDEITKEIKAAVKATDWHDQERHYRAAMAAADRITPQQIREEEKRIAKAVANTQQDSPEFKKLIEDQRNLSFVKNAKAKVRADLGLACIGWAQNARDDEHAQKFREIGCKWIKAAAEENPRLNESPELKKRVLEAGLPPEQLNKLLPDLSGRGKGFDYYQYDGSKKTAPDTVQEEKEIKPKVQPNPQKDQSGMRSRGIGGDTPANPKTEKTSKADEPKKVADDAKRAADEAKKVADETKKAADDAKKADEARRAKEIFDKIVEEDEAKAVKSEAEYYRQLAEAGDKPVLIKIGSEHCLPCKAMAPNLKETEEKGDVKVVRILYERTEGLAVAHGANEGVPITKFGVVTRGANGRPEFVELTPAKHGRFDDKKNEYDEFIKNGMAPYATWMAEQRRRKSASLKR